MVTLNQSSSLLKRIVWSVVSKAADRSNKVNAMTLPSASDDRISFVDLKKGSFSCVKFPLCRLIII